MYASANNSQENNVDEFTEHLKIPKLSDADRDRIEGPLSYEECKKALDTFQNNKAPGEDGFTVEFYMFFFDLLGHDLVASFNAAYDANELTISQRRGVITLIPKEDGSLLELSNWRPVTLLNVNCKIATKAIARRIEPLLPNLVHTDQTGFIKGRYIGENIRLIIDIMEHTKSESIPGILVSLDFRKAFDSLEWSFMMKALDIFNFGTSIKRWISTFYTKIESAAINNGFMTNWFRPSRGVRQGCPLSPYLFVLSTEILSSKIRQEPSITGIKIFGHEIKLSQFADDTNLFCADLISVENALKTVGDFGRLAGLKLNIKKSKAIWLGKWEKNKSYPLQLKWLHSPVRLLGIHVSYDEKGNNELNFNLKIRKLQTKLDMWRSRDLTLFGKVLIIKEKIFTSLKTVCRETKLKEFQYKLIHRIVVTKKELYRYGIKEDDECIYCGEKDSINHTFRDCHFVKIFIQRVINWFNIENKINFNPSSEERLFGILSDLHEKVLVRKFNYTMLFMRYYIYANKLHNKPILLQDFVGKMIIKYRIEKL